MNNISYKLVIVNESNILVLKLSSVYIAELFYLFCLITHLSVGNILI